MIVCLQAAVDQVQPEQQQQRQSHNEPTRTAVLSDGDKSEPFVGVSRNPEGGGSHTHRSRDASVPLSQQQGSAGSSAPRVTSPRVSFPNVSFTLQPRAAVASPSLKLA